jgi:nickel transport protein
MPDCGKSVWKQINILLVVITILGSGFLITDPALAHKVSLFAWVDGDTVHAQGKFSGGRKAQNASIEVYGPAGKLLLEGKTDQQGAFSFKVPTKKGSLKIVLVAGMGHQNQWIISEYDILEASGMDLSGSDQGSAMGSPESESGVPVPSSIPVKSTLSLAELEQVLENALDKKLNPMMKILTQLQVQEPSWRNVFGGIGYIFGLVGVGAYFHYRKKGG